MLENTEAIFGEYARLLRRLKKKSYRANMEKFRGRFETEFRDMLKSVNEADDKAACISEIAAALETGARAVFGKNGKIRMDRQTDMNLFMIYYVFPLIQLLENEDSKLLCDGILDHWHKAFRNNENMGYTTYDDLYNSFSEKIFGIF